MDVEMRSRWMELTTLLGVEEPEPTRVLRDLWRRYDEPHRAYHTLAHIRHVLDVVEFLRSHEPVVDIVAVRLAAWFHDAVCDPQAPDNEERSADFVAEVLEAWGIPDERRQAVAHLVLATQGHVADGSDEAVLVDADLAILAADPDTYGVYRRAVRVEHGHLPDEQWAAGRAALLRTLLTRDHLFATATMRARGEQSARRNLAAELTELGSG